MMGAETFLKKNEKFIKPKREKAAAPLSKIIVRKLPPTFTEEEFKEAIAPIPEYSYFSFVAADNHLGPHAYSRAYLNFTNPEEIYIFRDIFDGYIFVDQKGNEFPAIVEYSPFPKIPKQQAAKKDARCGTILQDADYLSFLESIENPETVPVPLMETLLEEIEAKERELKLNNGVLKVKTPLIEFVEQRGLDRMRGIDRKRRKELDRRRAREEERKRRREATREFRKRDDPHVREDRGTKRTEDESGKRKEEEKSRVGSSRDKERNSKRAERIEDNHQFEDKKGYHSRFSKEVPKETSRSKRYSEARRKDERDRKKVPTVPFDTTTKHDIENSRFKKDFSDKYETTPIVVSSIAETTTVKDKSLLPKVESTATTDSSNTVKKDKERGEKFNSTNLKSKEETTRLSNETDCTPLKKTTSQNQSSSSGKQEKESLPEKVTEVKKECEKLYKGDNNSKSTTDDKECKTEDDSSLSGRDEKRETAEKARKIRNKDRPTMQIYRPGMSRLSERSKSSKSGNKSSSSSSSPIMDEETTKDKTVLGN